MSAAQNRFDRKIALEDPSTAGPAQPMDAVVNNTSKEDLEVIKIIITVPRDRVINCFLIEKDGRLSHQIGQIVH